MPKKKRRLKVGDVFAIPLSNREFAYGRVCPPPRYAFYKLKSNQILPLESVIRAPVAFIVFGWDDPIRDGTWPVVGHAPLPPDLQKEPLFFKKDIITGKLTIYRDSTGKEVPATKKQCKNLECAAVWDPDHVIQRLEDLFAGRKNQEFEADRP